MHMTSLLLLLPESALKSLLRRLPLWRHPAPSLILHIGIAAKTPLSGLHTLAQAETRARLLHLDVFAESSLDADWKLCMQLPLLPTQQDAQPTLFDAPRVNRTWKDGTTRQRCLDGSLLASRLLNGSFRMLAQKQVQGCVHLTFFFSFK
ncbi:hypothetical protein J3E74DRAFT_366928 [Bipolaris maydis]|nr:hypothetical protein J3E74DRAFT_366928 [Bipolaris maydis]